MNFRKYLAGAAVLAACILGVGLQNYLEAQGVSCSTTAITCVGGGGGGAIVSGTTAISGGATTQVCYNQAGVIKCGDSGFVYNETTDSAAVGGTLRGGDGVVGTPTFSFNSDTDTGLWWRGNNSIEVSCGGAHCASFNNSGALVMGSGLQFGWSSTVAPTNAADTGLRRLAAGVVGTTLGGANNGWLQNSAGEIALALDYTNATATYSNTLLSVTLVSGRTYNFSLGLMLSESTAADGVKIDFNGGAATITNFRVSCVLTNDTGAIVTQAAATSTTLAGVINATATVTTAQHLYACTGTIVPSSSSTFIVRAGQNAHTTGTLTVHRGSWLSIRDANPL